MDNNGIMYPITIPEGEWPRNDNGDLLVAREYCQGVIWGDEECVNGGDSFLRNNDSPQSLVPPNWVADMPWAVGEEWRYFCPACVATIRLQNETDRANGVPEDDIEEIGNEGQSSNEPGTGRAIHGNPQPPQESYFNYLERINNEASENLFATWRAFEQEHGRSMNAVEMRAITREPVRLFTEYRRLREVVDQSLQELGIVKPPQENDENQGAYYTRLENLLPKDYLANHNKLQEPTPQELKEQAKKLYKNHPEHLRLALEQIDKDEEGRRKEFHDEVLGYNMSKKRDRDDKDDDGRKKKKKKKGGRRRKTRRKSRRRKRRKTRRKRKRKKRSRKRR